MTNKDKLVGTRHTEYDLDIQCLCLFIWHAIRMPRANRLNTTERLKIRSRVELIIARTTTTVLVSF